MGYLINFHVICKLLVLSVIHVVLGILVLLVVLFGDAHDVTQVCAGQLPFFLLGLKLIHM